jgi:acetyl esterase/lipase
MVDICIDESVEFAKKLKRVNIDVRLEVLGKVAHGFLPLCTVSWVNDNLCTNPYIALESFQMSKEHQEASLIAMEQVAELLSM